jgi:magnesium-protoporphyrin O-methyltransferase
VFTVAPRTPFLMAFFGLGKLFPRSDRSPVMIPHSEKAIRRELLKNNCLTPLLTREQITSGFYISACLELRA